MCLSLLRNVILIDLVASPSLLQHHLIVHPLKVSQVLTVLHLLLLGTAIVHLLDDLASMAALL